MKDSAYESFSESAQDALDFARCQRPDGSFYGTSGQCRKGSPAEAKEKELTAKQSAMTKAEKTATAAMQASRADPGNQAKKDAFRLANMDARNAKDARDIASKNLDKAKKAEAKGATAPKAESKAAPKAKAKEDSAPDNRATQANVRKMDKEAKAADKKAEAADKVYQKAAAQARKIEAKAAPAMRASRADPKNQAKKDTFRVANMEARNARDKAAILSKQARKLDKEAKALNKAATKLDKAWRKSQGIK